MWNFFSRFVDDPHMPASDISIEVQSKFVQASLTLVLIVSSSFVRISITLQLLLASLFREVNLCSGSMTFWCGSGDPCL
jgi:hypothetical protein